MRHKLRRLALDVITKTPLEPAARKIYAAVVPSRGNTYDKQSFLIMKTLLKEDSNCIDVGSYRGEILTQIMKISPRGKHFAFEPVPENYKYLADRFPSAKVYPLALSDKRGQATFNHVVGRPARSGLKQVEYPDTHQEIKKIEVKIDTLDNVIPKNMPIHLLKIDVEGAELSVLRGAKSLLKKYKPVIIFEHALKNSVHYDIEPQDIYDFLSRDVGMKIHTMKDFINSESPLSQSKFDDSVKNNTDSYFVASF